MAQSPLILIGGAAATILKGRGALQDVEQVAVVKSIVKYYAVVDNIREIVPALKRAFYEALSGDNFFLSFFFVFYLFFFWAVSQLRGVAFLFFLETKKTNINKNI